MFSAERQKYIVDRLNQSGIVHVKELANDFKTSETTIRRDLLKIEKDGYCTRVHGGAIRNYSSSVLSDEIELNVSDKTRLNCNEKIRVCKEAAKLVKDGDCVFLDGGTTIVPLIDYLIDKRIKIVTHSDLLVRRVRTSVAEIIVVGGKFISKYAMTIGPIAYDMMRQFNFDIAFIGCSGVSLNEGQTYTAEMETRSVKAIAMQNATKKYLLIDHSKLTVRGFTKLAKMNEFDAIYCDYVESINANVPENWIWVK